MALDAMRQVTASDSFREMLLAREKAMRDEKSRLISARLDGIEEGDKKATYRIARAFLAQNVDVETIRKATGLTADEIETLRAN